jgi:hypothetical protein
VTYTANEKVTGDGKGPSNYDGNPNGPGDCARGATVPGTTSIGHPCPVRHVDPDSGGSGGGFEICSSSVTP